jgi:hypothetical protein
MLDWWDGFGRDVVKPLLKKRIASGLAALVVGAGVLAGASTDAGAFGWLSRLARGVGHVGEVGGTAALKAGKTGIAALDSAAAHVAMLPKLAKGAPALAAHVTPEGHWKFVNREGLVFTAATPEELARVGTALAPEAAPGSKLALYLSEDTVFAQRAAIKDLPGDAELHVVVGDDAYRLRTTDGIELLAEVRPNVVVSVVGRDLFDEAAYRLSRPLNRSNIRTLALETGGPKHLSSAPRYDPATKTALVDQVDPAALPAALTGLRGQTALISGRIESNVLTFRPSSGPEQTLDIARLAKAAEEADVNLVLVNTAAAQQPGGRNWLWQKVAVAGLDDALKRATFADFLSALGGTSGELTVNAAYSSQGRVLFSVLPTKPASAPLSETLGGWIGWDDWLGDLTGHVAVRSVEVFARDQDRERELEDRIVPGIPSSLQFFYLGSLVMGLIAWQVSTAWWGRIWPPEQRGEYAGRLGYWSARVARTLACVLIFMPIVGLPALFWLGALQLWNVVTAPFRGAKWLIARLSLRRA